MRTTAKILAITAAAGLTGAASASVLDLTTVGASGSINSALFEQVLPQPTGTGVIDPFVRIQMNGTEQGYNTSSNHRPFDEKGGIWTHDLRLSEVGTQTIEGIQYYAFQLDINESSGGSDELLSLDKVKIYTSTVGSQNTTNLASLGTLRYDLDSNGDNWVKLDYSLGSGSGSGDMRMFIATALFASAASTDFLYLYSAFGTNFSSDAGFEEWSTLRTSSDDPNAPTPGTVALMGAGGLLIARRRR